MSYNLFAHEEDDENYYGFRKNPQQEAQKLEEEELEDSRFNFELYTWPRIQKKMLAGKEVGKYEFYDVRLYGNHKQLIEVEAYRKAFTATSAYTSHTEEEKNTTQVNAKNTAAETVETAETVTQKEESNNTNPILSVLDSDRTDKLENASTEFYAPQNPDYIAPLPVPLLANETSVEEGDDVIEPIEEVTQPEPQLPPSTERGDLPLGLNTVLSADQQERYHWEKVKAVFAQTSTPGQRGLTQERFEQWVRLNLSRGWNFGEKAPSIFEVKHAGFVNGFPVIEAYLFRDAYKAAGTLANLVPDTGQHFYWKKKISGELHISGYGTKAEKEVGESERKDAVAFNQKNVIWSAQLVSSLYAVSLDLRTYNKAISTKQIDTHFTDLVIAAQRVLYADTPEEISGKLTEAVQLKLNEWASLKPRQQDVKRVYAYFLIQRNGKTDNWELLCPFEEEKPVVSSPDSYTWTPSTQVQPVPNITQAVHTYASFTQVYQPVSDDVLVDDLKNDDHSKITALAHKYAPTVYRYSEFTNDVYLLFTSAQRVSESTAVKKTLHPHQSIETDITNMYREELMMMTEAAIYLDNPIGDAFRVWSRLRTALFISDKYPSVPLPANFDLQVSEFSIGILYEAKKFNYYNLFRRNTERINYPKSDAQLFGAEVTDKQNARATQESRDSLAKGAWILGDIMLAEMLDRQKESAQIFDLSSRWLDMRYYRNEVEKLKSGKDEKHSGVYYKKLICWYVPEERDTKFENAKTNDPRLKGQHVPEGTPLPVYYGYDQQNEEFVLHIAIDQRKPAIETAKGDSFADALETVNDNSILPEGVLYYLDPFSNQQKEFVTEGGPTLSTIAGFTSAALAMIGFALAPFTGGLSALPATLLLTGALGAGVVAGVSRMYELEQSDKLTPGKIAFEVTMIAACLLPFGKGLKWLGGELYVAVTGGVETAAVGLGVYYFTHDFIVQYRALDKLPEPERSKAMLELLAMSLMMGFLTYKAVRGVSESLGYKEPYQPKPGDQNRPSDALVNPGTKKLVTEQPESTNTAAKANAVKPGEVKPAAPEVAQESSLPPFTQEQLTYSQSGNIEYLKVKLETGELVTLKRENGGEWFVSKRGAGKTTDAEILGRVPGEFTKVASNEVEYINGWTKEKILALPVEKRPPVAEYISEFHINEHLSPFKGKASYLLTGDAYRDYILGRDVIGRADGQFISTTESIDIIIKKLITISQSLKVKLV
jgi:hypothetical protein